MDIMVKKSKLYGFINAIPSKSIAHRVMICSAISETTTDVKGITDSADIQATKGALENLGATFDRILGSEYEITPIPSIKHDCIINVGESGSTFRFILPLCLSLGGNYIFKTGGRLNSRPISELSDALISHGAKIVKTDDGLIVSGRINGGLWQITGEVSSQFVSGLLMALPLLKEDSVIEIIGNVVSNGYIELTLDVLKKFSVNIKRENNKFYIAGGQKYICCERTVIEGDWSNAAPFLVMGALNADKTGVVVSNLNFDSVQGDKRIIEILTDAGVNLSLEKRTPVSAVFDAAGQVITKLGKAVSGIMRTDDKAYVVDSDKTNEDNPVSRFSKRVSDMFRNTNTEADECNISECDRVRVYKSEIKPLELDVTDIPDIAPYIAVLLASAEGKSKLYGVERLREKESDRLQAIIEILNQTGIKTELDGDCLAIYGGEMKKLNVKDYNDHRMVMTGIICGSLTGNTVVPHIEALDKSYPQFLQDFKKLCGVYETL